MTPPTPPPPIGASVPMLAGIVGWPVGHSLSPRLHGHWLRQHGIDGQYLKLPVAPESLAAALHGLAACGFRGVNVTVPHKQAAVALCTTLDDAARRMGAVNTIVFDGPRLHGSNTDGAGFLASLGGIDLRGCPVLLLGAGGAARGIAASLTAAGALVTVTSRRAEEAQGLVATQPALRTLPWDHRHAALADQRLLVNATAGGMQGKPPLELTLGAANAALVVADIVYAPRRTALLAGAESRGLATVEGIDMLLHQAVPGFAAWFGVTPTVDAAARDAVLAGQCG